HLPLSQNDPRRGPLAAAVAREFPSIYLSFDHDGLPGPRLTATEWHAPRLDWWAFDTAVDGLTDESALHLVDDAGRAAPFAIEVLNRCQRAIGRRNRHSQCSAFDRALRAHRQQHDSPKPLVIADARHTLDVWQWT